MNKSLKKFLAYSTIALVTTFPLQPIHGDIEQYQKDTDELYSTGVASQESTESSMATTMIAWGIGLTVAIAITIALLHQSSSSQSH